MAFVQNEKLFSKKWFIAYALIVIGSFILAAGFVFFINPYNIVPGGVYGIGIVVHHLTKGLFSFWPTGIPVGLFGLVLNVPLTIIGIKVLGPRFGVKTVIGFVLTSVFMDMLTMIVGENDPLGLAGDVLMACVFGGVLIGFGLGLIFKSKATSGGSDSCHDHRKIYPSSPGPADDLCGFRHSPVRSRGIPGLENSPLLMDRNFYHR